MMLVNRSGTMVVPFMTLYLTESMGYTIGQAGIVMAIFGAGAICGGFIGGKLTDKFGFYHIQLFTLAGGGIMFMVLGQMRSYPLICIFTFLLSIINESFRPANAAAVGHYSEEDNRTRSYSLNRLAINLGWALGGALGGFIASRNYHLLFIIDGITNIGAAILLWMVLAPSKNKASVYSKPTPTEPVRSAYRDKAYMWFTVLTIMFAYVFFQFFSTIPVFYKNGLHLSEFQIGMIMAMNGIVIALFEMVIVHRLEGKRHNLQYIPLGVMLIAVSFLLLNVYPGGLWLALGTMLLATIGEILSMPFMNSFWISRTTPYNRGQYAGLYTIAWSVAQVLGPGTGAQIAEHAGFKVLWWFVGGLCLVCSFGYYKLRTISD